MRFFVLPLLLLAAAANAEVFHFAGQTGASTVYGVRGAVTVGAHKLTGEKTALEYNGTLALEQVREGEFLAKFTEFALEKYGKLNRKVQDRFLGADKPESHEIVRESGIYEREMLKPVKFFMKEGKVVRMEAQKEQMQYALNIYRAVLTLLQNQARKPLTLAVPHVENKFEDGITGNCKVQYEILSQPEDAALGTVYNMTKTKNYKECIGRPVYLHLKDTHRGCAGVCDNHKPENFLDNYEEENTDYRMNPTPGCPVNRQRKDTLVTVQNVAKYNITNGRLDAARIDSIDVYRLFGGEMEVHTRLQIHAQKTNGPKVQEPQNTEKYETLQFRLPKEESELDIPVYALMKEHSKHQQYPKFFQQNFEEVIRELRDLQKPVTEQGEEKPLQTPVYMIQLIQAISGMNEEELRKTIPTVVKNTQPKQLSVEDKLRRQVYIELLGKAGSKAAVKVTLELIRNKTFTPTEVRRVLQDIAGFQSYPDTEMIEDILNLCIKEQQLTSTGKATACVAAGKVISKACDSKVFQWAKKQERQRQTMKDTSRTQPEVESEEYEMTMGQLAIKPQLRCTPEKLQKYVERLAQALHTSTEFKQVVAYINGLAKVEKPEVLPELIGYVNGTAHNMNQIREQDEQTEEAREFIRRVAILSLRNVAAKYPKEVNPIVRVVFLNTTEKVQTRIVAFDVWMNTQPAQWEIEKVMQVANKDSSLELTNYVYTALKTAMHAKEPCYQLLAQRIRDAWTQIRPFDLGMEFSHLRSRSYYDIRKDYGIRGIWKMISSNTTILPAFSQAKLEQVRGPFMKTLLGAKLLVKGGDRFWEELVAKDGLLERFAKAVQGQIKNGERQQESHKLMKDIAEGLNIKDFHDETPKAVLFWKLFSGEAIIPIDRHYIKELQHELLQTVSKFGKEGVSGHFLRVFVPTKAFHVEPTTMGFPIVHSTIHPVVISVRYENLKIRYENDEERVVPKLFELTGTIHPTVLSLRQARAFVADKAGSKVPTMKVSNIKEFNLRINFRVAYEHEERRFKINVKPQFERLYHSGHCTQLNLVDNFLVAEGKQGLETIEYGKCIKSMNQPIRREHTLGGRGFGMALKVKAEAHEPFAGLPIFGSKDMRRDGFIAAIFNRLANKGMKHHRYSVYLMADQQKPVNEWNMIIDIDSNVEQLAKMPVRDQTQKVQKVKVQYQPRRDEKLDAEFQQVIRKVEQLLEKSVEQIHETLLEKQMLIKIEGRNQGQTQRRVKIAMKKVFNFQKTEQQLALAVETDSQKGLELFANVSYPKIPSFFHFDRTYLSEDERMNGTIVAKLLPQEEIYRINFNATRSEEQLKQKEHEWFETRCLAEQAAAKTLTDACKKAILKQNSLDRMQMEIQLPQQVSPKMRQFAKKLLTMIKYKFFSQMRTEVAGRYEQEQLKNVQLRKIHLDANTTRVSPWSLLYNVRIEMPRENVTLSNIRVHGVRPVHMQLGAKQQLQHVLFRGQRKTPCVLGEKAVRTYDNVTFGLDVKPGCEYVLTRDTQGTPDFTVTFKVVKPETFTKKVRVQLVNTIIELEPYTTTDRTFKVIVNGTEQHITFEKPLTVFYAHGKKAFIHAFDTTNPHHTPIVQVYTQTKEIHVVYDTYTVETFVARKYKGVTRGICGNNDNEQAHEFIGPQGTEYEHANEFIASYGIGHECQVPVQNTKEQKMEHFRQEMEKLIRIEGEKMKARKEQEKSNWSKHEQEWHQTWEDDRHQEQSWEHEQQQQRDQQRHGENRYVKRTAVAYEDPELACFSYEPVETCKKGYTKEGIQRTIRTEYLCLKKHSEPAKKALQQARQGVVDIASLESHKEARLAMIVNIPKCERHD